MNQILTEDLGDGIHLISLNRPDRRNALSVALLEELCGQIQLFREEGRARVLIFKGQGPVFCAGLDLIEAQDSELTKRSGALVERMLRSVYSSPFVTISLVHGAAVAGGAGLMSACDLVLSTPDCRIGYPEVRRGLVAGLVMTFLKRQLGERHARELLLLAELISGERAAEIGLVNRVVSEDQLVSEAMEMARSVVRGAPQATATTKQLLDELYGKPVAQDLIHAESYHLQMRGTPEAKEGLRAFQEKREPHWLASKVDQ